MITSTDIAAAKPIVLDRVAIAAIAATFFLMGALVALYGPLLEHLTRRFDVSLPVAGAVISVHYLGGLAGVLAGMQTLQRRPAKITITAGLGLSSAGSAIAAMAPAWPVFLGGVLVLGVGFGALVIALNQLVAYSAGRRRSALLNALNAAYSGGAVVGPVLVAALAASNFSALYLGFAVAMALVVPIAAGIPGRLPRASGGSPWPGALGVAFIVAFVFYVAIEAGTGGWMTSHLESTRIPSTTAATLTSGFWLALFTGRLAIALVPADLPERTVVLVAAAATTLCFLAASIPGAAPVAYLTAGLAMAPLYPTGIVWLAKLRPDDARTTAWLFPATGLGGIAGPAAIGVAVGAIGVRWIPAVLAAVAAVMAAAFLASNRIAAR